jgi:hypothetical protein
METLDRSGNCGFGNVIFIVAGFVILYYQHEIKNDRAGA